MKLSLLMSATQAQPTGEGWGNAFEGIN